MKYKYFLSYKYHRVEEYINENNEKVIKQWDSYSSDPVMLDFQIRTFEDVQKAEKFLFDFLRRECEPLNQNVTALLLLGYHELFEWEKND